MKPAASSKSMEGKIIMIIVLLKSALLFVCAPSIESVTQQYIILPPLTMASRRHVMPASQTPGQPSVFLCHH